MNARRAAAAPSPVTPTGPRARSFTRATVLVVLALASTACGTALRSLPSGPGAPASDLTAVAGEATAACAAVDTITAEIAIKGRIAGRRVRGRMLAGLAAPSSVFLDAAAPFGASFFLFAAADGRATLLLPRDGRVLRHDDPAAVLEAVAGVPLSASELRAALTGCALTPPTASGRQIGPDWRVATSSDAETWFHRPAQNGPWRVVAVRHTGSGGVWRADYADFESKLPRTIRLVSGEGGRRFDLELSLSQVEVGASLGSDVFTLAVPPAATPISLDELRRTGPFGSLGPSTRLPSLDDPPRRASRP